MVIRHFVKELLAKNSVTRPMECIIDAQHKLLHDFFFRHLSVDNTLRRLTAAHSIWFFKLNGFFKLKNPFFQIEKKDFSNWSVSVTLWIGLESFLRIINGPSY